MSINATLPQYGVRLGLVGSLAISLAAAVLAGLPGMAASGLGWLPLALALGIAVGNLWPTLPQRGAAGIAVARGRLMRWGIALYGLHVGADALASVGWSGPLMALLIVASTLTLAVVGGRLLGIHRDLALLLGSGSAICGAAAIAATDSVLEAPAQHVAAAIAAIVVFGTLGMVLLPLLYPLNWLSEAGFGLWIGLSVHELGHVVAAAAAIGEQATSTALVEKMLRVMLLAPAVVGVALYAGRRDGRRGLCVPPFMWGFIAAIALNASGVLPPAVHQAGAFAAQALLAIGLAALGANTRFGDVRRAGARVWLLAAVLWVHLLLGSLLLIMWLAP